MLHCQPACLRNEGRELSAVICADCWSIWQRCSCRIGFFPCAHLVSAPPSGLHRGAANSSTKTSWTKNGNVHRPIIYISAISPPVETSSSSSLLSPPPLVSYLLPLERATRTKHTKVGRRTRSLSSRFQPRRLPSILQADADAEARIARRQRYCYW